MLSTLSIKSNAVIYCYSKYRARPHRHIRFMYGRVLLRLSSILLDSELLRRLDAVFSLPEIARLIGRAARLEQAKARLMTTA
jgi:hypothetical protein